MATAKKVTESNHLPGTGNDRFPVYSKQFNALVDVVSELEPSDGTLVADTISESTSAAGVTVDGVLLKDNAVTATAESSLTGGISQSTNSVVKTTEVTLTATEIVGTDAGDIGHSAGAVLVAAQSGITYEFISAVLIYDFDTAAYTGGADDLVVRQGTTAVSAAIAAADLLGDTADDIAFVSALSAADIKLTANSTLNLAGTAYTQPGTAAGVLRVVVTYREITTNL